MRDTAEGKRKYRVKVLDEGVDAKILRVFEAYLGGDGLCHAFQGDYVHRVHDTLTDIRVAGVDS